MPEHQLDDLMVHIENLLESGKIDQAYEVLTRFRPELSHGQYNKAHDRIKRVESLQAATVS